MSSFIAWIKHPKTGKPVKALYIDDYFGKHKYGVAIIGEKDTVYREEEVEIIKTGKNNS
jgi:hypothetical protein